MKQQPQIIQLPKIVDPRGNLSFFESPRQLPFEIARTYWVYDVSRAETHGSHPFYVTVIINIPRIRITRTFL